MKHIYIIDYLGVHCDMHYYLEAFKAQIKKIAGVHVQLLSNFSDDGNPPFFFNQYNGRLPAKLSSLLRNIINLRKFVRNNPDGLYIYLTYGNRFDPLFIMLLINVDHIIDIHEAIAQNLDKNKILKNIYNRLYSKKIRKAISHSGRTDDFLREFHYQGLTLKVPHFRYVFPKNYNKEHIANDIKSSFSKDRINLLFFGNVNESKGIDILLNAFNILPASVAEKSNIIIAGKDFDGKCHEVIPATGRNVNMILRHINDDELVYAYTHADIVCLPYRKTSQSGILEMAFYFQKPILASDIPYFREVLKEFPSFGKLACGTPDGYSSALCEFIENFNTADFFKTEDYDRYTHRKAMDTFLDDFRKQL